MISSTVFEFDNKNHDEFSTNSQKQYEFLEN